jgi:hypothetical protein
MYYNASQNFETLISNDSVSQDFDTLMSNNGNISNESYPSYSDSSPDMTGADQSWKIVLLIATFIVFLATLGKCSI